jgi:hypothetical protein
MLSTDELHLLEPLDAPAPQAAHMFHELRRLGYKVAVGWVVRPQAAGDETIYDAYMREAGITGRTEEEIARLQRWRRENDVMWVSELFRADGITLRDRYMKNLAARARRCESDAIRLCNIAFGRGRGPANQSNRPRVGLPTPAAWDVVDVGSYVWHDGALGRVRVKGHEGATIAVFAADVTPRRVTDRTNVTFTMSGSSTACYDRPPLLVDTATLGTSGRVHVRYHEVLALRAVANHIISPADPRFVATCSAGPSTAGSPDIQHSSRVDSDDVTVTHQMLPWGCHYRNRVSQAGHAWVAADRGSVPQVARAMNEATA